MKHNRVQLRCLLLSLVVWIWSITPAAAAGPQYLIPGGNTVGIQLETEGLVVTEVEKDSPAALAGLRSGDRILFVNHKQVQNVQQLVDVVQQGQPMVIGTERNEKKAEFYVIPAETPEGYQMGAFLRDHLSGIGTVTYYDPETMTYGALGHGVYDQKTNQLLSVAFGAIYASSIDGVRKGARGEPGELRGAFDLAEPIGTVSRNHVCGIFGSVNQLPQTSPVPVAQNREVKVGQAQILANVSGTEVARYDVEIMRIDPDNQKGRNLLLRITDEDLLQKTGGIVQGMSGSPILQNGKLVGAVTHVLIQNPTCGYGILMEQMLEAAT